MAALLLALAVAVAPLAADRCGVACELGDSAHAKAAAPACHHQSSATTHIGQAPKRCGQPHRAVLSTSADASKTQSNVWLAIDADAFPISAWPREVSTFASESHSPPGPDRSRSSSPLRI